MVSRAWTFTLHESDWRYEENPEVKYIIYQLERAPSTGKLHIQGYVQWTKPSRMTKLKTIGLGKAHAEIARGSPEQNKAYCSKEESRVDGPWEYGEISKQGQRNDLATALAKLDEGESLKTVIQEAPNLLRVMRNLKEYKALTVEPRHPTQPVETTVLWGPAGTGKSKRAFEENPGAYWLTLEAGRPLWWDGYEGQDTVIIDDYDGEIPYRTLLKILDRYPLQVHTKGNMIHLSATKFVITSNKPPENWYPVEDLEPLRRRLSRVELVTKSCNM